MLQYRWSSYHEFATMRDSSFGCQEHQPQKPFLVVDVEIIDVDFVLGLFSNDRGKTVDSFKAFHEIMSNDNCLDIIENRRLTDNEAIKIIKRICNVPHCTALKFKY